MADTKRYTPDARVPHFHVKCTKLLQVIRQLTCAIEVYPFYKEKRLLASTNSLHSSRVRVAPKYSRGFGARGPANSRVTSTRKLAVSPLETPGMRNFYPLNHLSVHRIVQNLQDTHSNCNTVNSGTCAQHNTLCQTGKAQ